MENIIIFLLGYIIGTHIVLLMFVRLLSNGKDKNRNVRQKTEEI